MPAEYSFVSLWRVPVSVERSWAEIERMLAPAPHAASQAPAPASPSWWPGLTVLEAPEALAPGQELVLAVRSPLGYRLRVRLAIDAVEPGRALSAVSGGDLRGRGRLDLDSDGDEASVLTFHWNVVSARPWMNATAPVLRPVFERAHARVMRAGERGLHAELARHAG